MSEPAWLTLDELSAYLKIGRTSLYRMAREGEIPATKIGNQWRFNRGQIDEWMKRRLAQPRPARASASPDLCSVLRAERVLFLESCTKERALNRLIDCLASAAAMPPREKLAAGIFRREEMMSTGIGLGIGVPHVRLPSVPQLVMAAGICRPPIADYESLDRQPVRLIFMLIAGQDQHAAYLKLLSQISSRLVDPEFRERLWNCPDAESFCRAMRSEQ